MQFTHEHEEIRRNLRRLVEDEINPHVDEWEEAEIFPAHEVFAKLGRMGYLGLTKPAAHGGSELDWSYAMVMAETLGHINCGAVPMAIGVQTDMATPALARFGSDELKREFLAPSISGEYVACLGVFEALRAMTYRAVELYVAGEDVSMLASMAKLKSGRLARLIPDTCMQFWGGMGYTWDNRVSRMYRDGRLTSIGGGADEVMLSIISKHMGTLHR
jgi:alkylation response protein AidB-like acyl-CoA dehydrogenase